MLENAVLVFDPAGKDETTRKVEDAMREQSNWKKINDFLDGKGKRQHLFFYFQKTDIMTETEKLNALSPSRAF